MGWGMSWGIGLFGDKRHRLDAGDFKGLATAGVGATHFVVEQNQVALGLGELGTVALIGARRQAVALFPQQITQFVRPIDAAIGTIEIGRPRGITFEEILAFVHGGLFLVAFASYSNNFMRILHTADWHLGRILGNHCLLDDQAYVLRQFVDLAVETRPDAIVIAGDLYDRSVPPADAVTLLDETLHELTDRCAAPVIAISGNHDSQQRLDFGARLLRYRGLHLFGSVGSAGVVTVGDTTFVAAPFAEPACVRSAFPEYTGQDHQSALQFLLDRLRPATGRSVAIAHAFVTGGVESESERPLSVGTAGQVGLQAFTGFAYAALGHLHRPQTLGNARYSGSLLKYSTSEAGQRKSVSLVDLDGGVEEFVLTPRRDLRCVTGAFDELLRRPPCEDYLYFTLTDTGLIPNAAQRLREVYPQFLGLELGKAKEAGEARVGKAASPMEMFMGFWQHVAGEEASVEQRAAVAPLLEEAP